MEKFDEPEVTLPAVWATNALCYPQKDAVICGDRRLTWREFDLLLNRVANALADAGLAKGDKLAVVMSNSIEMLAVMFGAMRAGACVVPLSTLLSAEQMRVLVDDCDARFLCCSVAVRDLVDPWRQEHKAIAPENWFAVDFDAEGWRGFRQLTDAASDAPTSMRILPEDECVIIYSSGTTGLPKGILHTHRSRHQLALISAIEMRFTQDSRALTTTALYSNGTFLMMLPAMFVGATTVILDRFSPGAALQTIERHSITHTFMVPSQYIMLLAAPEFEGRDLSNLRAMLSAGSPLRREIKAAIHTRIGPVLYELYGTTEGFATMLKPEQQAARFDTVGPALIGHRARIIDNNDQPLQAGEIGEIVGHGGILMREYYRKPQATADNIWRDERGRLFTRTGDIGRMDEEGFITILDRKKDMIISGGFNLFPVDIEQIVAGHEAVLDVTVIGIPHEKWDESPMALVIRREGVDVTEDSVLQWANSRLAKHQRLSRLEFRDEFPRNALGKVLKRLLREPYWTAKTGGRPANGNTKAPAR